jgi:hypothetical protein
VTQDSKLEISGSSVGEDFTGRVRIDRNYVHQLQSVTVTPLP